MMKFITEQNNKFIFAHPNVYNAWDNLSESYTVWYQK